MGLLDNIRMQKRNKSKRQMFDPAGLLTDASPRGVQEAYKTLRTNVIFSIPKDEDGGKVIGVTSAMPGEGKSINAINHAISFAQLEKKVLLIDGDLRRPTVAAKLQIPGVPGLSNKLIGQAKLGDCMRRVPKYGIDVLPSGSIPPDPTWLLQSAQMSTLISQLKKMYDYIILDLPPVNTVADASIASRYVDGYLIVVRHNSTDMGMVGEALEQLRKADGHIFGFIYNDVSDDERGYYRRSYRYKYQEGYYQ